MGVGGMFVSNDCELAGHVFGGPPFVNACGKVREGEWLGYIHGMAVRL